MLCFFRARSAQPSFGLLSLTMLSLSAACAVEVSQVDHTPFGEPTAPTGSAPPLALAEAPAADAPAGTDEVGTASANRAPAFKKTRCIDPSKIRAGTELNYPCDGVDVWVSMPSQCTTRACGLVFNIHGGAMSNHTWMNQATNMIALGAQADYIVVHPHKGTWSVSKDKSVVFSLIQQVAEAFDVDRKRIHSTGYSQGGQISWAIGCEHADVVASIAPSEEINRVSNCWKTSELPARELPVLFAYGRQDTIGGGITAAQKLVDQFVASYAMKGPEVLSGTASSRTWRRRWTSERGNVLEFISHNYTSSLLAGHCLPMAGGRTIVSCSEPIDYDWGKEVIAFFRAHPMN